MSELRDCPFCGTRKLITRIGDHVWMEHQDELAAIETWQDARSDAGSGRLIPDGSVWKFTFEVSHAPHYVIQHANGSFSGIYAPVENVTRDTAVPFGLAGDTVAERAEEDHVDVVSLPREQTPWADGVFDS